MLDLFLMERSSSSLRSEEIEPDREGMKTGEGGLLLPSRLRGMNASSSKSSCCSCPFACSRSFSAGGEYWTGSEMYRDDGRDPTERRGGGGKGGELCLIAESAVMGLGVRAGDP